MLRKSVILLAGLCSASYARAQLGVYAAVTVDRLGGLQSSPLAISPVIANGVSIPVNFRQNVNPSGGTFGAFYDFRSYGPVRLGADVRVSRTTDTHGAYADYMGTGTHIYSALGGVRATFATPLKVLAPYAQASVGIGRSDYGFVTANSNGKPTLSNGLEYHVYGGLDYRFLPSLAWRTFEVGYGGLSGSSHQYPLLSVSTGLVYRFGTGD